MRIFPARSYDDSQIGKACFVLEDHRSWDWIGRHYPVNAALEARIKSGEQVSLRVDWITTGFPKETEFPEGSEFRILEP
jgi:hypothetical protein